VGADKLHERDLPTEVEGDDEAIIASRNLEYDALAIEYFSFEAALRTSSVDVQ
jgi:hypothetical protein